MSTPTLGIVAEYNYNTFYPSFGITRKNKLIHNQNFRYIILETLINDALQLKNTQGGIGFQRTLFFGYNSLNFLMLIFIL